MIKQFLKRVFFDIYDNIWKNIQVNILTILLFIPFFFVVFITSQDPFLLYLLLSIISFILTIPIITGIFYILPNLIERNEVELRLIFTGYKKFFKRTLFLSFLTLGVSFIILANIRFYFFTHQIIGITIAILSLWIFLFFFLIQIYAFPLMVKNDFGIKETLKYAFFFTVDNLGFTIFLGIFMLFFIFIFIFTGIGLFLFFPSITIFQYDAMIVLLKKYNPNSEEQILEEKKYNRTLKEIIKPWTVSQ